MFVILEGFDKVGKTAIKKGFGNLNKWQQIVIDRGPAGYLFYDELFGREDKKRIVGYNVDLDNMFLHTRVVVFYIIAQADIIIQRHKDAGEELPIPGMDVDEVYSCTNRYRQIVQDCYSEYCHVYEVDTTTDTLEQTMAKIGTVVKSYQNFFEHSGNFIKEYTKRYGAFDILKM